LYSVKIAGLANCFRIASTSARDGPVYGLGVWSEPGIFGARDAGVSAFARGIVAVI
jgi:hypothetical protein